MIYISNSIEQKVHEIVLFLPNFFFFLLKNIKKKLYANIPEMFESNPKASIQKYPASSSWYSVFSTNVSDFYMYFTIKNIKV
jgi:hypothetical protein